MKKNRIYFDNFFYKSVKYSLVSNTVQLRTVIWTQGLFSELSKILPQTRLSALKFLKNIFLQFSYYFDINNEALFFYFEYFLTKTINDYGRVLEFQFRPSVKSALLSLTILQFLCNKKPWKFKRKKSIYRDVVAFRSVHEN